MKDDGFEPNVYTWNGIIAGPVESGHRDSKYGKLCSAGKFVLMLENGLI